MAPPFSAQAPWENVGWTVLQTSRVPAAETKKLAVLGWGHNSSRRCA